MNFNPNAMMQKQVEKMISQRFGSVDGSCKVCDLCR